MVQTPAWPFLAEVFPDEVSPLVVHGLNQAGRLSSLDAASNQPVNLVLVRRINEDVEDIRTIRQEECGSAPHDDAVPFVGGFLHDPLREADDDVGVQKVQPWNVQASLEAATQERFEQAVVQRIRAFFPLRDRRWIALRQARNLVRQPLIPERPAQSVCQQPGDVGAAAAVFALDRDDSYFHAAIHYSACAAPWPGSFFLSVNDRNNMTTAATPRTQNVSMYDSVAACCCVTSYSTACARA